MAELTAEVPSLAYASVQTIGGLILGNPDFRLFLGDLGVVAKQVFADTAFTFADAARDAGEKLKPSEEDAERVKDSDRVKDADADADADAETGQPPSGEDLTKDAAEASKVVVNGLTRAGEAAVRSVQEKVAGDEKETLLQRLKQAVVKLRGRPDYSDSVNTVSTLLQRYAKVYSRAVDSTVGTLQEDVSTNADLDRAVRNFWSLVSSFGDRDDWTRLENRFNSVLQHSQDDPQFERLVADVGGFVQRLLTDPDTFDHANEKVEEMRRKWQESSGASSLRDDLRAFLDQLQTTLASVSRDEDVRRVAGTSAKIVNLLAPAGKTHNPELFDDLLHVFVPLLIQSVQHIPIPRVEVAVPEIDLLLENLIIEPGKTVNNSSFLPYKFRVETFNDLEVRKARFRVATQVRSFFSLKVSGLSVRADDVGYWMRAHTGLLRFVDEGIASFHLDEKGMDVHVDVMVGKDRLEQVLTLKGVHVYIHKLTYTLRKSKFSFLAWLFKPILQPVIRKVMERQVAKAIEDGLRAANRELIFARERLRATRISDPQDLRTFVRAVLARLAPEPDPDVYATVGVAPPSRGVFAGKYAPGSVVKLWNEQAARAGEIVEDRAADGWRNDIFDVQARPIVQ